MIILEGWGGDMWVFSIAMLNFFSSGIFNVRYCDIIEPCGTRFFILLGNGVGKRSFTVLRQIAALFICPLLSNTGRYFLEFTFNGQ